MSAAGLEGVRLAVDEVKSVITTLSDEEWQRPSRCHGWRVVDLVAHMSSNYKEAVEPSPPPPEPMALPAEQLMEMLVEPRKTWSPEAVRDEYLAYCDGAVAALAALQEEPLASTVVPLADLGSYPMHQLADAYAFDHYCHLRIDLLAPEGPIERSVPPADAARLGPTIGWMITGLPQMQPGLDAALGGLLRLTLTGPGGGSWVLAARDGAVTVEPDDALSLPTDAVAESDGHAFVLWGTRRAPWRDHVQLSGASEVASTFLDALNIV